MFRESLKKGSREEAIANLITTANMVASAVEVFKSSNNTDGRALYGALSRLATVEELQIPMAQYDNLMFVDGALLDPEVLEVVESKLQELKHMILVETISYGDDAGWKTKWQGTEEGVHL